MMTRTQISLPQDDYQKAKTKAREMNISLAEYLRRLVAGDLSKGKEAPDRSALFELFDAGDSGGSDIAGQKHSYLGDAAYAEHLRETSKDTSH